MLLSETHKMSPSRALTRALRKSKGAERSITLTPSSLSCIKTLPRRSVYVRPRGDMSMNRPVSPTERLNIETVLRMSGGRRAVWFKRWYLAAAVAIAALAALWMALPGSSTSSITYATDPATRGALTVIVTATGSVQPTNQVDVSSELSGIIRHVLVDYNSPVKVGQVLAQLDTDKLAATVDSSRAKLAAAKAKVGEAEATVAEKEQDYNRKQALVAKRITSNLDFEVARAAYRRAVAVLESTRAEVAVAEADLKLNETNLAKASIYSPINGVVLARNVEPGQTVASSFQAPVLFSIAEDLTQMEIQVDVDEADIGKVSEGQKATFTVDAYPDQKFAAEIRQLRFGSEIVQGVVTYKAVLTTDNSQLLLRPGMTATAEIAVQHIDDALLIANAALRFSPPSEDATPKDGGLLQRLLPGRPRFRPASGKEQSGPNRTVWTLSNGTPVPLDIVVGATDGKRTQVVQGDIAAGLPIIVDATATKR
jgi:HlyD family secretion protein